MVYRIGDFRLDTRLRELRHRDEPVHVQPRVFEVLLHLLSNPHRAISRDELLVEVWGSVSVEDGSVSRAIRGVRAALAAEPELADAIQTIRGFGYRLAAEVTFEPDAGASGFRSGEPAHPFVGREAALARIEAACSVARLDERQIVLIVGEPGTGKSTLARRALDHCARDFLVGEGQSLEGFGTRTPYLPVLEALTNLGRTGSEPSRQAVLAALSHAAPSWMVHLPLLFDGARTEANPIELSQDQMARELIDAIELMGKDRPVALFLEDLHWADQSTLALLDSLAMRSVATKLLLICTARSSEAGPQDALRKLRTDLSRSTRAVELETDPLSTYAVREYVAGLRADAGAAQEPVPDQIVRWLHARTEGHPLFLAQLVDHLMAMDLLDPSTLASTSRDQMEAAGIPDSLGQLILQWIGRLEPADRRLLEAASVAGFDFDLRTVQAALESPGDEAEGLCDGLCGRGWLQFRDFETWPDGSVGARFRFGHAMYAEALYGELQPGRKARLHRRIAARLERAATDQPALSSEIASHYERCGDRKTAARHHVAAAVHAASHQAVEEAIEHGERGLEELAYLEASERNGAESDLCMSIALSLAARHGFGDERVETRFRRANELAQAEGDAARELAATWGVSACLQMRGEIEAGRSVAERLLVLAERAGETGYIQFTLSLLSVIAYFQGRFADCVAHAEAALDALRRDPAAAITAHAIQDTEVTVCVYGSLAYWHLGDADRGRALIERALERARRLGQPFTEAYAEAFSSIFHYRVGEPGRQREHARLGFAVAEAAGIPLWREVSRFMETFADPPAPEQLPRLRQALQDMASGGGLGGTFFIALLAEREAECGDRGNVRTLCDIGLAMAERTTEHNNLPAIHLAAARIADDEGTRDALLHRAEASARELGSVAFQSQIAAFRESPGPR